MKKHLKTFLWLTAFSIAMGFLESAVVIDLRELYYPQGFDFPLAPISNRIALTEFLREAATIIMLVAIGVLTGKTRVERFAAFIYSFAVWDIFYYVFLKLMLGWPISLFTWDILFLIPVPWVGPVLAPCLVALSMIILAFLMVKAEHQGYIATLRFREKLVMISGCAIVLFSFMWDYIQHISQTGGSTWKPGSDQTMFAEVVAYIPQEYNWWIFAAGQMTIIAGIFMYWSGVRRLEVSR